MAVIRWDWFIGVLGLKTLSSENACSPETSCTNIQSWTLSTYARSHVKHFSCERLHRFLSVDNTTQLQVSGISTQGLSPSPSVHQPDTQDTRTALLGGVPSLLHSPTLDLHVAHTFTYHITTSGSLVLTPPCQMSPECCCIACLDFYHMLDHLPLIQLLGIPLCMAPIRLREIGDHAGTTAH